MSLIIIIKITTSFSVKFNRKTGDEVSRLPTGTGDFETRLNNLSEKHIHSNSRKHLSIFLSTTDLGPPFYFERAMPNEFFVAVLLWYTCAMTLFLSEISKSNYPEKSRTACTKSNLTSSHSFTQMWNYLMI